MEYSAVTRIAQQICRLSAYSDLFDGVAEDLSVAERVLIAHQHDRLIPRRVDLAILRVSLAAAARLGDRVNRLRQRRHHMVRSAAAAVEPDVDNEAVFASYYNLQGGRAQQGRLPCWAATRLI